MHKNVKNNSERSSNATVFEDVYRKVKEMIYYNRLAPGQRVVYTDLAASLGVSITPVVQALNRLEGSNLVKYVTNKGYFVAEITESEARNLYLAREALELFLVPRIIKNLDFKNIDEIRKSFKKYGHAKAKGDRRNLTLLDAQFHLKIAEFAYNPVTSELLKQIFERIYLKYRPEYLGDDRIKEVIVEHRKILVALRKGNAPAAVAATRRHIRSGMAHVVGSLKPSHTLGF